MTGLGVPQSDPPTPTLLTSGTVGVAVLRDVGAPADGSYYVRCGGRAPVGTQARRRRRGRVHAAGRFLVAYPLSDEGQGGPRRELRLGPDRAGNMLEIVVLLLDDGDELVIHASG